MTTVDKSLIGVRKLGLSREVRNPVFQKGADYACEVNGAFVQLFLARPDDSSYASVCRAHMSSTHSRSVCVTIPTNLTSAIGWVPGEDYITIRYGTENDILLSKSTQREILSFAPSTTKPAIESGVVRRGRYLYLTSEEKDLLEVPTNLERLDREGTPFYLKMTTDFVGKTVIKVEKMADGDEALPTMSQLMKLVGGWKMFYMMPRTFKFHLSQCLSLPAEFAKRCNFTKMEERVNIAVDGQSLFITALPQNCGICGVSHDPLVSEAVPVYLCRDCADALPATTRLIKETGSLKAAAKQAKKDLRAALNAINASTKKGV